MHLPMSRNYKASAGRLPRAMARVDWDCKVGLGDPVLFITSLSKEAPMCLTTPEVPRANPLLVTPDDGGNQIPS